MKEVGGGNLVISCLSAALDLYSSSLLPRLFGDLCKVSGSLCISIFARLPVHPPCAIASV